MIRFYSILLCLLVLSTGIAAQGLPCGTKVKGNLIRVDSASAAGRWQQFRLNATYPLIIKLYVVVFADNDGTNIAAPDSMVRQSLEVMRGLFAPHDICFVLSGIEHANSTDLNQQYAYDEESELEPYLREGFLCIFVHKGTFAEDGSFIGGRSYGIPNTYLSIDGDELDNQPDIIAHEVGHCFGLYHTFESGAGEENVNRTGGCRDCEDDGDLLCDTPADRNVDASFISASTCEYTGNMRDECGVPLQMATTNIMTYGRASCRDRFTNTQGARARDFIIDPLGDLVELIAADIRPVTALTTYSSGFVAAMARTAVNFESPSFNISGTARLYSSARMINIKPGTDFNPGSGGLVDIRPNPYCQ